MLPPVGIELWPAVPDQSVRPRSEAVTGSCRVQMGHSPWSKGISDGLGLVVVNGVERRLQIGRSRGVDQTQSRFVHLDDVEVAQGESGLVVAQGRFPGILEAGRRRNDPFGGHGPDQSRL